MAECTILGTGILTWPRNERRTDRYGYVHLIARGQTSLTDDSDNLLDVNVARKASGRTGTIIAHVLEVRTSTHIGDLFRKIYPTQPELNEDIVLGTGILDLETNKACGPIVGLRPILMRDFDWLSPKQLYRAHEQFVELRFYQSQ